MMAGSIVRHFTEINVQAPEKTAESSPEALYSIFPIDLNRAGVKELILLPAIGETKARAIVAHRAENGPFTSLQELLQVRGIGPKTLEKLRELVTIDLVEAHRDSLSPLQAE